jgi:hypothetical protein
MLWPAPRRGERITLACGCEASIRWRIPIAFLFGVQIDRKARGCERMGHVRGRCGIMRLESMSERVNETSGMPRATEPELRSRCWLRCIFPTR